MGEVPVVEMSNGVSIPQVGFGMALVHDSVVADVICTAIEAGYRSFDTASIYGNEEAVGKALVSSGVPRDELFVATKLWKNAQGYDAALQAFDESLKRLGLEYIDLFMIHWPAPARGDFVQTWKALEKLAVDGRVRAIGVSNFQISHLRRLSEETSTVPAFNQIELHPNLVQDNLRAYHSEHGIVTQAWSPLAGGRLLQDPGIRGMAEKYGKSPAQVILRWHLELGNVVIPKSVTPSRIRENIDIFDFELAEDDVMSLSEMHNDTRVGPHPDHFS
ncbi:aldo/keto reductase [Kibdelosporangium philippinense]|uniref:Aldo/keto reductase n=1 Tax=Kibdelosporangium philippinense TaxID=211113 RepID=A0ABS8ZWS4_9PSEU|nr:aldo/keto reductase [Kibdelosporangium philippinense]MCE7012097.1 aldo/keto reductase [Kibdelosporangium philippinense]